MFQLLIKRMMMYLAFSLPLMAMSCGEDAFNAGGGNPADTVTVIDSFSVVGNSTDPVDDLEIINGSAAFDINWDITSSATYTFSVYLSANSELGMDDVEFFSGTCGAMQPCSASGDFQCSFVSAAKTLACNGSTPVDVASVLTGTSPQSTYIFLEATNEMMSSTDTASQQVKFAF